MKTLNLLLLLLLSLAVSGCASIYNNITAQGDVNCTAILDKPATVNPFAGSSLQGNVPLQGGEVSNPTNAVNRGVK